MYLVADSTTVRELRSQLFDKLSAIFPEELSQPRINLMDFITY